MKSKKTLPIIILLFVLLLGSAYLLYDRLSGELDTSRLAVQDAQQQPAQTEPEAAPDDSGKAKQEIPLAPDFTVYDADGAEVRLYDYIGKPIVLNFWASWCGPCQREMPDFDEKYLEMGGDIAFLMVNMTDGKRETLSSAKEFIGEKGYSFPVFYDEDSSAAIAYGVYSLPTTYFIDAEGYVIARASGTIDAEVLQQGIDMITAE